ncbi:MAG TPA: outer membrane lipid asymmetry maintenance protein MlaD [Candidatus Sumerlaeota bacterium]|nr:outer membrane lipid asymmetry maintenance protein MlaD [Candidatus Sumerlaeota bacterium]HPS01431.1 outer membrane lipid asymmetry maintenance protein MlaD [Candidatus Sumerlaeota bacterium]
MKKTAVEFSVGLFVLIGLICVGYLTIKLGKKELVGDRYYRLTACFTSISGLKPGAMVEMAGVQIGKVETIQLDQKNYQAVVTLKVEKTVPIFGDSIASVKTSGLIGDKYVSISPGGVDERLADGGTIPETESAIDLEKILSQYAFGKV